MKKICSIAMAYLWAASVFAQPGSPDLSFGANGSTIIDFGAIHDLEIIKTLVVPTSGKIVFGGMFYDDSGYGVARLKPDGQRDSSFHVDGLLHAITPNTRLSALAVQTDGKTILAGVEFSTSKAQVWLKRLTESGQADNTFGLASVVRTDVSPFVDYAEDIAVLPDGKILVAATIESDEVQYAVPPAMAVLRYHPNGKIDSTFGINGVAKIQTLVAGRYIAEHLAVFEDGKILVSGEYRTSTADPSSSPVLAKLLPNGQVDISFGSATGIIIFQGSNSIGYIGSMIPQPNGDFVVAGSTIYGVDAYFIAKFSPAGIKYWEQAFYFLAEQRFGGITQQPDGKFLVVGFSVDYFIFNEQNRIVLARHRSNGDLDGFFGENGHVVHELSDEVLAAQIRVQPNGKIIVCASVGSLTQTLRYFNDLNPTIDVDNPDAPFVTVFPNPASTQVSFKFESMVNGTLLLCQADGAVVYSSKLNNILQLDLSIQGLPAGMYFWRWVSDDARSGASGRLQIAPFK